MAGSRRPWGELYKLRYDFTLEGSHGLRITKTLTCATHKDYFHASEKKAFVMNFPFYENFRNEKDESPTEK